MYHIIPIDDLRPHIENKECLCNPEIRENLLIHNSFDGREYDEEIYRKNTETINELIQETKYG